MKEKTKIEKSLARSKKFPHPTLLKFQNGNLAAISKDTTKFSRTFQKRNGTKLKGALVVVRDQIYHGVDENDALTDNYLCVRNKNTNNVRVIPIDRVRLNNQIYKELQKTQLIEMTTELQKNVMMKQFGGRKALRFMDNKEKMQMNIDIVKDDLDNTVKDAVVDEEVEKLTGEAHYDYIRPKSNKEATKVEEIYDLNDVLSAELLDRLDEEAKSVFATSIEKLPISSTIIREAIQKLQTSPASVASLTKIKLLIYMDCLINLLKSRKRLLNDLEMSGISEKVENHVREHFSAPHLKKFTRTPLCTEKALCHFLVLALLVSEKFECNLNVLSAEVAMPKPKIVKYAQIVYARRTPRTDMLSLRIPKKVPTLTAKPSRKSK